MSKYNKPKLFVKINFRKRKLKMKRGIIIKWMRMRGFYNQKKDLLKIKETIWRNLKFKCLFNNKNMKHKLQTKNKLKPNS